MKDVKKEKWVFEEALASVVLGILGGMLPDILEPATHPNHRQFFHGLLLIAVVFYGREKLYQLLELTPQQRGLFDSLLAGYSSHLYLDGLTPKGLPLGGRLCIN